MTVYKSRIGIYQKKYELNYDNLWVENVSKWKDVWADVSVKIDNKQLAIYQFVIKFFYNFPQNFNVTLNGSLFNIVRMPIFDPQKRWIKFFGRKNGKGED